MLLHELLTETLNRTWGYWIGPRGEIDEVGFHGHYRVRPPTESLFQGWISVQAIPDDLVARSHSKKKLFTATLMIRHVTPQAARKLLWLINELEDFDEYVFAVTTFKDLDDMQNADFAAEWPNRPQDHATSGVVYTKRDAVGIVRRIYQEAAETKKPA